MTTNDVTSNNAINNWQPPFRPYRVRVARCTRLSPHFMRIVFTGEDLDRFGIDGYDQRIKILLPLSDGSWPDSHLFDIETDPNHQMGWYERWRALPNDHRNVMRTYTIRSAEPQRREVTVDFVLHQGAGPVGVFAEHARMGEEIGIVGPNAQSPDSAIGIDFHPGHARRLLLVGDETAVPAIGSILESLIRDHWRGTGTVLLEVPAKDDILELPHPTGIDVDWRARAEGEHGQTLIERTRRFAERRDGGQTDIRTPDASFADIDVDRELLWDVPDETVSDPENPSEGFYAWIAGEAATVRDLRRILVRDHHIDRHHVAFMGYWRAGKAEI